MPVLNGLISDVSRMIFSDFPNFYCYDLNVSRKYRFSLNVASPWQSIELQARLFLRGRTSCCRTMMTKIAQITSPCACKDYVSPFPCSEFDYLHVIVFFWRLWIQKLDVMWIFELFFWFDIMHSGKLTENYGAVEQLKVHNGQIISPSYWTYILSSAVHI